MMNNGNTPNVPESPFGEPISVYTREQALEDGQLVDANAGELRDVTAQHFRDQNGVKAPIYMTATLFALMEKAVKAERHCNDWRGVWHDVLSMARVYGATRKAIAQPGSECYFRVIITGTGRKRYHTLAVACDGAALTFMLPGEI